MQYNDLINYNLSVLVKKYKKTDVFKTRAYSKALLEVPKTPILTIEDVKHVGGAKTQQKLQYLLKNNKNLEEVDEYLKNDTYAIIDTLQTIHGIGPAKAKDLYENHNIRSIEDLRSNHNLLNNIQQIGLNYFEHITKKIPYKEMVKHEDFLKMHVTDFDFTIAGSYRRKANQSSDIDILLTGNTNMLNKLINILTQKNYIDFENVLAHGEVKFMGLCKLPKHKTYRRIDILYTPPHEYPFALLYFTGNFKFNVDMRRHATSMGLSLNEQSLTYIENKQSVNHTFKTEKDIFEYLNYTYVEPEKRSI
tara:strand:+ start:4849 stop:5766 length:918 start_codon:yes stop_codon:yes gene_type:complete